MGPTISGRLMSSEPRLQNIPIRTDEGRRIRDAFRPQRRFRIAVNYFKPSGKWYAEETFEREFTTCGSVDPLGTNLAYIHDVVSYVRGLRDTGGPGALPGLSGDGWDGPIHIQQVAHLSDDDVWVKDAEHAPHLLMPRGV